MSVLLTHVLQVWITYHELYLTQVSVSNRNQKVILNDVPYLCMNPLKSMDFVQNSCASSRKHVAIKIFGVSCFTVLTVIFHLCPYSAKFEC